MDNLDYRPSSRILLVMSKCNPGCEPRERFSPFRVVPVPHKNIKESEGMLLDKFEFSSPTRRAVEEMHNQRLSPYGTKPRKVRVATLA